MSAIAVAGDTSGSVTLQAPAVAGSTVLTLPAQTGTVMVNGPAFNAYANASQTLTNATFTLVALNTEVFDTNNNFDSTTTYKFTPTITGYYQINAIVTFSSTGGNVLSNCITSIFKNGTEFSRGGGVITSTSILGQTNMPVSDLIYMNGTTDYLQLYVYAISAGSPIAAYFNNAYTSRMSGFLARSA